jgi:hypothetical protein
MPSGYAIIDDPAAKHPGLVVVAADIGASLADDEAADIVRVTRPERRDRQRHLEKAGKTLKCAATRYECR